MLLLLLAQAAAPTVGDTIRIERVVGDVGNAVVRPQLWTLGQLGEQLGPAEVVQGARGVVVRYALVLWYPGAQTITMPGPVVVRRDGSSDTLATSSYRVEVESVLPSGVPKSTLAPKPARGTVRIAEVSWIPPVLLGGSALLGLALAALWRRRRGRAPPRPAPVAVLPTPEQLERWAEAGEYRAALEGWSWRLARRIAPGKQDEALVELQALLDDISRQVYLPGESGQLARLCERAARMEAA
ncbi:MAG TPA: hypothetical protein VGQ69_16210 [Gemmatimonadales bacterium]|jgi:hypothetical protein|nr:hypothetical protein [Gemmatimonadales bacterium]